MSIAEFEEHCRYQPADQVEYQKRYFAKSSRHTAFIVHSAVSLHQRIQIHIHSNVRRWVVVDIFAQAV